MANEKSCPRCRRPLSANAPEGFCPECLMEAGFATGALPEGGEPTEPAAFTPPPIAELTRLFPQLEIMELLGQGGMGAVYKARQKHLERVVALKILPPRVGADPAFAERFTREARALARLNHPGIVTLYESGQAEGLYFFLMEFVDGVSLRALLRGQRLKSREALAIVPQICEALQYAHDEGIVHRDIKPENILLDRHGRVKVADFGLAKLVKTEALDDAPGQEGTSAAGEVTPGGPALTAPGKVMGTPNYMAPEQRESPQEVDHRADIYSLGVVFYEMLTGELPLGKFVPPSKTAAVDVRLDEVVLSALAKEPEERYQQASEMRTDVESIATTPATSEATIPNPGFETAELDRGSSAGLERPRSGRRARRIAIIGSVTTAVLLLGFFGMMQMGWIGTGKEAPGPESWGEIPTEPPPRMEPIVLTDNHLENTAPRTVPPRDSDASSDLIDLTERYNGVLDKNWHNPIEKGNDLRELPSGVQTMAGTLFDVRGLIAVSLETRNIMGGAMNLPPIIQGIPIGRKCNRLHFLHSAFNAAYSNGEQIGRYIVHLANGELEIIPIVTGKDVLDWHKQIPAGSTLVVAWEGDNAKTRGRPEKKIHLFKTTWENPAPDVEIQTIDLEVVKRGPSPFLVALTVE